MKQKIFYKTMVAATLAVTLILGFMACDDEKENEIEIPQEIPPLAITLHVEEAATLPNLIDENVKYEITDLTLTGNLNGTDIRFIREMAGCDSQGGATNGRLAVLNLTEANIVSGGASYYFSSRTSDNTIGHSAFYGCTSLTSITIPNSVTSIGGDAFNSCTGLTSITIPNSVTSIGDFAFGSCTSLTSITIPNSVTSIGYGTFSGCTSLTSITIPNSVTSIGEWAFNSCTGLTSITIPNSVTSIEWRTFSGCTGLTSIIIPNSVTSIGNYAFYECRSLTSITIGNSVTSIGQYAFNGCTGLKEIHSKNPNPPSLGSDCFYNVDKTTCKLYVPKGSYTAYINWGFDYIIEE